MEKSEKQDRAAVARMRSHLYGILATVYRQEASSELLKRIKDPQFSIVLSDLEIDLFGDLSQNSEEELLEALAVEHARLFLGPGKHVSPHESVHHKREDGQWGQLWGASTVEVKKFIEATGLNYDGAYRGVPDHISVELEFMELLTQKQAQAESEKDEEGAQRYLEVEKRFLQEHLIRWVPEFCEAVRERADLSFYRELAGLTRRFIEFDWKDLKGDEKESQDALQAQGP